MSASPAAERTVAGDSAAVAFGTALSRATGLARVLIIPAIFGATALGDMFLAVNALPQTIFATFGGQALSSMLVPVIVRSFEKNPERANMLGARAMGIVCVALAGLVALALVFHRAIAGALAWGVDEASDGAGIAAVLLLMIVPQMVLYGAIAVLIAQQQARGKFLLPAFAPTLENVGLVVAVLWIATTFDDIHLATSADTSLLVALGLGSTIALLAHLALQALGAARLKIRLLPGRPKSEPELVGLRGQVTSSLAWTMVFGVRIIALTIAAGWAGGGGIQALQIGYLIQNLPMALIGYPVAAALLPRLSLQDEGSAVIARGYSRTRDLVLWVLVPIAVGLIVMSEPFGRTLALGRFGDDGGPTLVAAAVAGLALAAASEAVYEIARQATLAYGDISGFKRSIWARALISGVGIVTMPMLIDGPELLLALGLVVSVSDLAALAIIDRPLRLEADSGRSLMSALTRTIAASVVGAVCQLIARSFVDGSPAIVELAVRGIAFVVGGLSAGWVFSRRGADVAEAIATISAMEAADEIDNQADEAAGGARG